MKATLAWLDDPQVFRVNQLAAHSDHHFFANKEEVAKSSSRVQSLNGTWQFHYAPNSQMRPTTFFEEKFNAGQFDTLTVPSHIELSDYDKLHYINTQYPWEGHEYRRPAYSLGDTTGFPGQFSEASYNPVGSYLKTFTLAAGLRGYPVSICFEGVEEAMFVWLNGQFVGYAEDSFTPSEFDLTPYLHETGENVLAVEVHKRSTAAYLEDQDFFRFFGIFRDVSLQARGHNHVTDLWIKPHLTHDYQNGVVAIDVTMENIVAGSQVTAKIKSPVGELLYEATCPISEKVTIQTPVLKAVKRWDYLQANLYTLELESRDSTGHVTEFVENAFGFRTIELKEGVMCLNGKRLVINGVNRHEWNERTGRVITKADMARDLATIVAANINGVRTSHYPNQLAWYSMCDEAGIHLMAETNLESHGTWQKMGAVEPSYNVPGALPQWREVVLDRAKTNLETFKNHPSILFWSLGNESYAEENIRLMNEFFKTHDPSRLVHYEGNVQNPAFEETISDMKSRMYATPAEIRDYLENEGQKPFILCEYMHDMGNSLGGMRAYMELLDEYPAYQGGYIWDFKDQALLRKDEVTGQLVMRYGGDFDDRPSDYEFSGDGLLFADGQPKPALQEVRYYYGKYNN
jgi:beta-galactosidase